MGYHEDVPRILMDFHCPKSCIYSLYNLHGKSTQHCKLGLKWNSGLHSIDVTIQHKAPNEQNYQFLLLLAPLLICMVWDATHAKENVDCIQNVQLARITWVDFLELLTKPWLTCSSTSLDKWGQPEIFLWLTEHLVSSKHLCYS